MVFSGGQINIGTTDNDIHIFNTGIYMYIIYLYMNTQIQLESVANAKEGNTVEPLYCGHPWDMKVSPNRKVFSFQGSKCT